MHHIRAEFGYEIGFVLSGNSSVTLSYTRDKGATKQPSFGIKSLCISTRDSENVITYNGVFLCSANPKKDISVCKGLRDVAMQPNFG